MVWYIAIWYIAISYGMYILYEYMGVVTLSTDSKSSSNKLVPYIGLEGNFSRQKYFEKTF